jgi:hypothetical protein
VSEENKLTELGEIEDYLQKKTYWISRIFMRSSRKRSILLSLIVAFGLYVIGFISMGILIEGNITPAIIIANMASYIDLTTVDGKDIFFMPVFIIAHIALLSIIGGSLSSAILVIPRIIPVSSEQLKKDINRIKSNFFGFLIALPFILYDLTISSINFFIIPTLQVDNEGNPILSGILATLQPILLEPFNGIMINPLVHWILTLSWVIEWIIFGAVLNTLLMYVLFIYKYTKKHEYQENLLAVIMKGEIDPLIRLGYKLALYVGVFMIIRAVYIIVVGYYWSDLSGFLVILIALPIIIAAPLQLVESDLAVEQRELINEYTDDWIEEGMKFLRDRKSVTLEQKIDLLLQNNYIDTLTSYRRETLKVYIRLIIVMGATVGSFLASNYKSILDVLTQILQSAS